MLELADTLKYIYIYLLEHSNIIPQSKLLEAQSLKVDVINASRMEEHQCRDFNTSESLAARAIIKRRGLNPPHWSL
jgi:hypothetical protein